MACTSLHLQAVGIASRDRCERPRTSVTEMRSNAGDTISAASGGLSLFAASGIIMVAVGIPNTFGVFQDYFATTLFSDIPPSQILIIGSLASSLYMTLGAVMGRAADWWGHEKSLALGSTLMVGGLFAASASNTFYQFVLSQGVMFGVGTASAYYPAVTISRRLFERHGLANGVVVSGGALGGCIFPYPTRLLLARYGLATTFRVLGYIAAAVLLPANLVLFRRCKAVTGRNASQPGSIVDFGLLRDTRSLVLLVAGTIAMTGFLPRYFLLTPSAIASGVDANLAAWLLGLMNGLSILGRIGIGMFADRFGKLTALVLSFVLCGTGHLAFWLPGVLFEGERAVALITVFVVFVGLLGSGFVSLIPVVTADIFGAEELASKIGLLHSVMGLGVFAGPSVCYAIVNRGHWSMGAPFSGLLLVLGGAGLFRMQKYL